MSIKHASDSLAAPAFTEPAPVTSGNASQGLATVV
jgi:hypothetical protein